MKPRNLENDLKFLELSITELRRMVDMRKEAGEMAYKIFQCTESDIIRMCDNIRKSALTIKNHAHLVGR